MTRHWKHNLFYFPSLRSQQGQVLISALAMSLGIVLVVGFLIQQSLQTEKSLRLPRIKSAMNSVEARIRLATMQPQTFSCPPSSTPGSPSTCTLNTAFSDLAEIIPGCSNGASDCGVKVQNVSLSGATLSADIIYQGQEVALAPVHLAIDIPKDTLQATIYDCSSMDPTKPVFAGYNADGSVKCLPLPGDCPTGKYASSVNVNTLALNCEPLPSASNVCGANQYLTGVNWSGGATFTVACAARVDPFAFSGFTPTLTVRTSAYSSPTVMPANGTCTPIATTTTTDTTTTTTTTIVGSTTTTTMPTTTTTDTTTTTTVTTTSTSTTTTTAPYCGPPGAHSFMGGGTDDTPCVNVSTYPWKPGSSPNPWCCSGTHHPTFGLSDTIGAGNCYWDCD